MNNLEAEVIVPDLAVVIVNVGHTPDTLAQVVTGGETEIKVKIIASDKHF